MILARAEFLYRRINARLADLLLGQSVDGVAALLARRVRVALRADIARHQARVPAVEVSFSNDTPHDWDGVFRRKGDGFTLELSGRSLDATWLAAVARAPAYLFWLRQCGPDVEELSVTLNDGNHLSGARFSPSTNVPGVIPIPDPYFRDSNGFVAERARAAAEAIPWQDRDDSIVWRGATTGLGGLDPRLVPLIPAATSPRLRLCMMLRGVAGTDVRFSVSTSQHVSIEALRQFDLSAAPIPEANWLGQKFAIDIDGHTNTWSNLLIRQHYGCCVLKVESELGYRQWYYDRLKPWEHYVPVRADMSDLLDRIAWVREHDAECREIAANGQRLAQSLTMESAIAEIVPIISANWRR